jgi:hypothetical protein
VTDYDVEKLADNYGRLHGCYFLHQNACELCKRGAADFLASLPDTRVWCAECNDEIVPNDGAICEMCRPASLPDAPAPAEKVDDGRSETWCASCGINRSMYRDGEFFTFCDSCWNHLHPADVPLSAPDAPAPSEPTDTERLDIVQKMLRCADFSYDAGDGRPVPVLIIEIPPGVRVGADIRKSLDSFLDHARSLPNDR